MYTFSFLFMNCFPKLIYFLQCPFITIISFNYGLCSIKCIEEVFFYSITIKTFGTNIFIIQMMCIFGLAINCSLWLLKTWYGNLFWFSTTIPTATCFHNIPVFLFCFINFWKCSLFLLRQIVKVYSIWHFSPNLFTGFEIIVKLFFSRITQI